MADIRCDDMNRAASAVINLQMGTNKYATQAGMNFGAQRHAGDIKCEGPSRDGGAVIGLQVPYRSAPTIDCSDNILEFAVLYCIGMLILIYLSYCT